MVNKKQVLISFAGEECVQNFKMKFTVLDEKVASRAIFPFMVAIQYKSNNLVELIPDREFTYESVNGMVNYLLNHGFCVRREVLANILEQACNLSMGNTMVCRCNGAPSYVLGVRGNTVFLHPVGKKYLDFSSHTSTALIKFLKAHNTTLDVHLDQKNRSINVISRTNICHTITDLYNILVLLGAVEETGTKSVLRQAMHLAFLDFANQELKVAKNITSYPDAHPLSKYRGVAKCVKDILSKLTDESTPISPQLLQQLDDALKGKGEFASAPPIIMKSLTRLEKNFCFLLRDISGKGVPPC